MKRNLLKPIVSVINGNFLTREESINQFPFIMFLTCVGLLYIGNTYYAERTMRDINKINSELKELRSEFITTKSDLMFLSKQSEVARSAKKIELFESVVPPKKLIAKVN